MIIDNKTLVLLELKQSDLDDLSDEEQLKIIKRKYRRLSLKYHPDQNKDDPKARAIFMAMAEAVAKIENEKEDNYIPEIHTYYTPKIIPLPDRAFDLLLQEDIDEAFEDLLKQFHALSTTHEKQRFAEKYAPFLNIAESLQKKTAELNKNRSSFLFERNEEALQARLIREWREMILRLFGEEYLDDFQYREALGTGNLIPVLATWKLCSPIKLLAAMINSVVLAVKITLKYYLDKVMESVVMDVQHQISAYQNNQHQ